MEEKTSWIDINLILNHIWNNFTFESFLKFLVVYFVIVWIAVLVWVVKDISNRTDNLLLQILSILIVLFFTPLWVFIYLLLRPSKTMFEKYYWEIEENLDIFNSIIEEKGKWDDERIHCFECKSPLSLGFKYCPSCKTKLKWDCESCWKLLYKWWKICPYCWDHQKNKEHKKEK